MDGRGATPVFPGRRNAKEELTGAHVPVSCGGMSYALLFLAIAAEVVATTMLKSAENFTRLWPSLLVVLGYSIAFVCLSYTLKTIPVGIAYATWSGVGIVLVAAIAWAMYGQVLDLAGVIGMGLIIAGVLIVNLLSKTPVH